MTKHSAMRALARLESRNSCWNPVADARHVRQFINRERQEVLILRRWVLLAADRLADAFNGADTSDGLIAEMRAVAKSKRRRACR